MKWRANVRSSLVYLVAIVAGFALAFLVVAFVVFPAGVIPRDVKVPNVMGLAYDDAVQRLAQAGLSSEKGEQRFNNSAPKMTVLDQTPPPGSHEALGTTVTLVTSGGQRVGVVPTLNGMTKADAQALLEKEGFELGDISEMPSDVARGSVVSSRPVAGARVNIPTPVALVVSGGAAAIQMPDLVGRDVDAARQTLIQLGIRNVIVFFDSLAVGTKGTIVGHSPVAGATMIPGSAVQLRVIGGGTTP